MQKFNNLAKHCLLPARTELFFARQKRYVPRVRLVSHFIRVRIFLQFDRVLCQHSQRASKTLTVVLPHFFFFISFFSFCNCKITFASLRSFNRTVYRPVNDLPHFRAMCLPIRFLWPNGKKFLRALCDFFFNGDGHRLRLENSPFLQRLLSADQ